MPKRSIPRSYSALLTSLKDRKYDLFKAASMFLLNSCSQSVRELLVPQSGQKRGSGSFWLAMKSSSPLGLCSARFLRYWQVHMLCSSSHSQRCSVIVPPWRIRPAGVDRVRSNLTPLPPFVQGGFPVWPDSSDRENRNRLTASTGSVRPGLSLARLTGLMVAHQSAGVGWWS